MNGWIEWNGNEINNDVENALKEAVLETSEEVLKGAQRENPLDEGTLQGSGIVSNRFIEDKKAVISYGGGSGTGRSRIPYAIRWHENSANFQRGRKRFYLRDPWRRIGSRNLRRNIRRRVGSVLG
jgi:hypothetical protein